MFQHLAVSPSEANGARHFNVALAMLYRSGYWIKRDKALGLGDMVFSFLGSYAQCAQMTLEQHKRRFAMIPKLHMIAHCAHEMKAQAALGFWIENPLVTTCQVQEDYIGRPARISRRVNIRSLHKSLIMRALIVYKQSLQKADSDDRGMDGYPDV